MGQVIIENSTLTDSERSNIECVRSIYRAFVEGDMAGVLAAMHPDVRVNGQTLRDSDVPYARSFSNRDEVAAGFALFRQTVAYQRPTAPVRLTAKGNRVLAVGEELRSVVATGEITENRWSMVWTFRDGKVAELRVLEDSVEVLE